MDKLSTFIDATSTNLYSSAAALNGDGNLMISPLSIIYATLMVYLGARGNTKSNLDSALHFNSFFRGDELLESFSKAIPELTNGEALPTKILLQPWEQTIELALANGLFLQEGFAIDQKYLSKVVHSLHASVFKTFFINETENSRMEINQWMAHRTGGRIKDLVPPGGVDTSTRLILTNALYFKAPWKINFDESKTAKEIFESLNGLRNQVDFMNIEKQFSYFEDSQLQSQYLEIPYINDGATLLVILPRDPRGVRKLEASLNSAVLTRLVSGASTQMVDVTFPKFKFESSFDVVKLLQSIGVDDVFSPAADLTALAPQGNLQVNKAFHKTFIDLNEYGTEAAAATSIELTFKSLGDPDDEVFSFVANRPFVFAIRHNPSKVILFIGRVENL